MTTSEIDVGQPVREICSRLGLDWTHVRELEIRRDLITATYFDSPKRLDPETGEPVIITTVYEIVMLKASEEEE